MRPLFLATCLAVALSGCATKFHSFNRFNHGFSVIAGEQADTMKCLFFGNRLTSKDTVQNYMLFGCAMEARLRGAAYIELLRADISSQQSFFNESNDHTAAQEQWMAWALVRLLSSAPEPCPENVFKVEEVRQAYLADIRFPLFVY